MQIIHCTGKLQKEMGIKKSDIVNDDPPFSHLGSWHANLIFLNRKKCILFANDKTLYNFIITPVSRQEIKYLSEIFLEHLTSDLQKEDLPSSVIDKIRNEYVDVKYGKSKSKSVLGSMNDLAFHYKSLLYELNVIDENSISCAIKKLNRMPMKAISHIYPIRALNALYP